MSAANLLFKEGDSVVVTGGYDPEPEWLGAGKGYLAVISRIVGRRASLRLSRPIELTRASGQPGWADFGRGSITPIGEVSTAIGDWLVVTLAYAGERWQEPIRRLQVNLCRFEPELQGLADGCGVGVWVESHATMHHSP